MSRTTHVEVSNIWFGWNLQTITPTTTMVVHDRKKKTSFNGLLSINVNYANKTHVIELHPFILKTSS